MPTLKFILTLPVLLAFTMSAQAQSDPVETISVKKPEQSRAQSFGLMTTIRPASLWLAGLDTDQNYIITRAEYEAGRDAAFTREDTSNSGSIGLFQLENWRARALGAKDAKPQTLHFDSNYDSRITRAEFNETLDFLFKTADDNDDDAVSFSELVKVIDMPSRPRRGAQDGQEAERGERPQRRQRR